MRRGAQALDPCELPREKLFGKHYRAALMGDGAVLPIEERLGRRLLRTIDPGSTEGRRLLASGHVLLCHEADEWSAPIGDALDRLEREARRRLEHQGPEGRRDLAFTLRELERHRRRYGS